MDEQEAVWLASVHLRKWLGSDADNWELLLDVNTRTMGWVVSFRHTGHFKPGDGPRPLELYVFNDARVEIVCKHGPRFHESRHQRTLEWEQTGAASACVQCAGSGKCYCLRNSSGDSAGCVRCGGSGKCRVCSGSGIRRAAEPKIAPDCGGIT